MADENTDRLALPLIAPGQAQKEMTHNEALAALDLLVQASVVAAGTDAPPADPEAGDCWIVGDAPSGAWAGRPRAIAGWTAGGWRFVGPCEGMTAWVIGAGAAARYTDGIWQVLEPVAAIAEPAGGPVIDTQARTALAAILAALAHHGLTASP